MTDDEREALVKKLILESLVFVNSESEPWAQMLANRILSALRRTVQGDPLDCPACGYDPMAPHNGKGDCPPSAGTDRENGSAK